ncbi:hypothetical protein HPP92_008786 [Vanilla planifolia]|uniref:Nicotianamine synthase n=1 Tax=Vanilla planifolia TaxID=51239 RepID=A0A835RCL1_VANPL|nr:hypothetical protein HPP92_008786 [Vanilla planifolia]
MEEANHVMYVYLPLRFLTAAFGPSGPHLSFVSRDLYIASSFPHLPSTLLHELSSSPNQIDSLLPPPLLPFSLPCKLNASFIFSLFQTIHMGFIPNNKDNEVPTEPRKEEKKEAVEEEEFVDRSVSNLIVRITELYVGICDLPCLQPSPQTNSLFTDLVAACIPPYPSLSLSSLSTTTLAMRKHLISLCSAAESHLERHYSALLLPLALSSSSLLPHLTLFPYFSNYLSLSLLESSLLLSHLPHPPSHLAFLGSGPLPLSSIVLASRHFTSSFFDNYDLDPKATAMAASLVSADRILSSRMEFITADAGAIGESLHRYGVVFLAALVGFNREEKAAVVEHLARHMAPEAMLVVRSAHGARMFLYPVVEPEDLKGFEVLSVYHPDDEVINSVIIARKPAAVQAGGGAATSLAGSCKCCERKAMFNGHGGAIMADDLKLEELPSGF